MSVYTRAGQRSQVLVDRPITASTMPSTVPISADVTARINVLSRPVFSRSGKTCQM